MLILLHNSDILVKLLIITFGYIILYIWCYKCLCKPSRDLLEMSQSLKETKRDLAAIKSVQQEFVRHSRLNRKVIQLEKDVAAKQSTYFDCFHNHCTLHCVVVYFMKRTYIINNSP